MIKKFFYYVLTVAFLTASIACWQLLFSFSEEADTFFVMNLGRYVLEHGIPYVDPFTIHENLKLVAQQWLSGIFFWEAYKNFGVNGLKFIDFIASAAMILIYWRMCLFVSGGNKILSFVMAFVFGILTGPSSVPRPHILSTPLLVAEVFMLEKFTRTNNAKFLIPLLPISMLIINLHAAVWLMTLVLCVPFLFVKNIRHAKFLTAAMVGIFLCGLINPYGLDAMTYVFRSYGLEIINEHIQEMFAPNAHDFSGKIFYLFEALMIFTLTKFKLPWRYIFLSGGIIFMALMHNRNVLLFYFIATMPAAYALKDFSAEKFLSGKILPKVVFLLPLTANTAMVTMTLQEGLDKLSLPFQILFGLTTLFMLYTLLIVRCEGLILHKKILPKKILALSVTAIIACGIYAMTLSGNKTKFNETYTEAIKFILRSEQPENISLYIAQGGGGIAGNLGVRYYIDSRSEVFIKANNGQKDIFQEYLDFVTGKLNYKDFFNRYKFTHIIITGANPFILELMSNDKNFRVIYESERVNRYDVIRCKIFVPR